jgi:hypothetical protein
MTALSPIRVVDTVSTNVPGPQRTLITLGRPMREIAGWVPLSGMRIGVSIVSYDGKLTFGIGADYGCGDAAEVVAAGIEHAIDQLVSAASAADAADAAGIAGA